MEVSNSIIHYARAQNLQNKRSSSGLHQWLSYLLLKKQHKRVQNRIKFVFLQNNSIQTERNITQK